MRIEIRQRLHPFSHVPGTCCMIPQTTWSVKAFPSRFVFRDFISGEEVIYDIPLSGFVDPFTVQLDLERNQVAIFGSYPQGYVQYRIRREENRVMVYENCRLMTSFPLSLTLYSSIQEKLSLGCHRSQDWERVTHQRDLVQVLPVWLRLGMVVPHKEDTSYCMGTLHLIQRLEQIIAHGCKEEVIPLMLQLFLVGFSNLMFPKVIDDHFHGIIPLCNEIPSEAISLTLLTRGASLIRSLFFQEEKECLAFLPCLPALFHAGRLIHLQTQEGDKVSLEWSKKLLKKVILIPGTTRLISLKLQKPITSFRIRLHRMDRGKEQVKEKPLLLEKGVCLYLDRFQK